MKKMTEKLTAKPDMVNHPQHYKGILLEGVNGSMEFEAIEIIDSIVEHIGLSPKVSVSLGNAIKYILRCGKKASDDTSTKGQNEKSAQDLNKASWYLKHASDSMKEKTQKAS